MYRDYNDISYAESPFGTLSQYMTKTFGWMFAGLLVTFGTGIGIVRSGLIVPLVSTGLIFATIIGELALVFVLSGRITKIRAPSCWAALSRCWSARWWAACSACSASVSA